MVFDPDIRGEIVTDQQRAAIHSRQGPWTAHAPEVRTNPRLSNCTADRDDRFL
jgi:hypothetical protein